jgi:hypothetical protein
LSENSLPHPAIQSLIDLRPQNIYPLPVNHPGQTHNLKRVHDRRQTEQNNCQTTHHILLKGFAATTASNNTAHFQHGTYRRSHPQRHIIRNNHTPVTQRGAHPVGYLNIHSINSHHN